MFGISNIAFSGNNIYALSSTSLFLSSNNGDTWLSISDNIRNYSIRTLAVSGDNIFVGTNVGILLSSSMGESWKSVLLINEFINTIAIDSNFIIIGTSYYGVMISTDLGQSWQGANWGLPNCSIDKLIIG